jgi:hypothetical protein
MVVVGEDSPSLHSPPEIPCDCEEATVENLDSFAGPEEMLFAVGANGNKEGSAM